MRINSIILLSTLLASTLAHANLWERVSTMGAPTVKPSSEYLIETAGWNIRVYEWVPADNPNVRCLFAAGSQKGGVACYSINE